MRIFYVHKISTQLRNHVKNLNQEENSSHAITAIGMVTGAGKPNIAFCNLTWEQTNITDLGKEFAP